MNELHSQIKEFLLKQFKTTLVHLNINVNDLNCDENIIDSSPDYSFFFAQNSNNLMIRNCTIKNAKKSFDIRDSDNVILKDNTILSSYLTPVAFTNCNNAEVLDNAINGSPSEVTGASIFLTKGA